MKNGTPNREATELETRYQPDSVEERTYQFWLQGGYFHADPAVGGTPYSIVIPPPNITGALHMGHALDNTLQDILIRFHRMRGENVLWMPGTDHAGIATQSVVEREILEQEGKSRHDLGREGLVRRIWAWREEYGDRILRQLERMGCSCDWQRTRFTLDEVCAQAVRHAFVRMFEAGLIYRGRRLINWDPLTQTALADDELEYETVHTFFWYINYPLADGTGTLTIATTRPETMLGDTAVAINPRDPRAKDLVGKTAILPLLGRELPIIADELVSLAGEGDDEMAEYSTGFLKVTPAHDPVDYEIGRRHNLPLVNILNPDGTINENGGPYQGLTVEQARERVVEDLRERGLLVETRPYSHEVAHSYRSHVAVEPFLSEQWFINTKDLARQAARAVQDGRISFFPQRYAKTYLDWLGGLRDWCISRQLWWGHRISVWYCNNRDCLEPEQYARCRAGSTEADRVLWRYFFTSLEDPTACPKCGGSDIVQDEDVLDTWFSSALWPFSTMGWPQETPELATYYPTNVLVTARDIITLWVARMVMMGLFHVGEIPFHHVHIYATILDGKGVIMSKSKGNGVDPLDIIATHGADAMRATLALMATETQDIRLPVRTTTLPDGRTVNTSDRFDIGRNFVNKLWNASRFVLMNLEGVTTDPLSLEGLEPADRWILSRLTHISSLVTVQLTDRYGFSAALGELYHFVWHDFCDWYVELAKPRLQADGEERRLVQRTLAFVLDQTLRLLHPFLPFITEATWQELAKALPDRSLGSCLPAPPADALIIAPWPQLPEDLVDSGLEGQFALLQEVTRAVRRSKRSVGLQEGTEVSAVLSCHDEETRALLEPLRELLIRSAVLESLEVGVELARPSGSVTEVLDRLQVFVPVADLVELSRERGRGEKQLENCRRQLASVESRLADEEFRQKAPPEVVDREAGRAQELRRQAEALEMNLRGLGEH